MNYPMGVAQVVAFHKVGQNIQLIAKNTKYTAKEGTPEARAVAAGFSDSLLATAPVVAQPHPERKSLLIDANALLLADIPMAATQLERTYRQPYAFDARNSSIGKVAAAEDNVTLEVSAHYSLSRLILPPPPPSPNTMPSPPITLPDVRSMFLGFHYSFAKLPEVPMTARLADERIGYFTTDRLDFTSDVPRVPVTRYVNRWRLEKKDPAAALSEPKQPIVFWLDRNIPVKYRAAITEGILEWNKAFEQIGFKDAVQVEIQPDDADFDTSDIRHASMRWMTVAKTAYRRHRPVGGRPAHRRDPRRRHRLRRERARGAQPEARVRHRYRVKSAMLSEQLDLAVAGPLDCLLHLRRHRHAARRCSARRCWRRAATSTPTAPKPRSSSTRPEGRDDARGRPYARPAPQLPRVDHLHARRSSTTPSSPSRTASPAR